MRKPGLVCRVWHCRFRQLGEPQRLERRGGRGLPHIHRDEEQHRTDCKHCRPKRPNDAHASDVLRGHHG